MLFPAQLEKLGEMLAYIRHAAVQVGFPNGEMHKIELACEEALVNVISYAYPNQVDGEVDVQCFSSQPSCLKIVIKDHGQPFNPLEHKPEVNVEATLEERHVGGLGVFLICQVMDEVTYQREGNANVLTLTKCQL